MPDLSVPAPISLAALVLNLAIGLLLALIVAWYYEHYAQSLSNRQKFARLLPVLTLTTALVITIVKSSLALSLGLVGALSIVRFRAAIKEPEELIFLFIAIAIGLGVGADQRWPTVMGVLLLLGYMAVRIMLAPKSQTHNLYLNVLVQDEGEDSLFSQINARLLEHVAVVDFRRLDSRDGMLQVTYFVDCQDAQTLNAVLTDLRQHFPIVELSFLQQEQLLGG